MLLPLTCSVKGNSYFFSKKKLSFNDSVVACGNKGGKLTEVVYMETWNLLSQCLKGGNYRFRTGVTACYRNQSLVSTLSNDASCQSSNYKLVNPITSQPCSSFVIDFESRLLNSTDYITASSSNCSVKEKYICETLMEDSREFALKYLIIIVVALLIFLLILLIYCYKKSSTNACCCVLTIKRDRPSIIIRRRREKLSQIRHYRVDSPTLSFCQANQAAIDAMKSNFEAPSNDAVAPQDSGVESTVKNSDEVSSVEKSKNERINMSFVVEPEESLYESKEES